MEEFKKWEWSPPQRPCLVKSFNGQERVLGFYHGMISVESVIFFIVEDKENGRLQIMDYNNWMLSFTDRKLNETENKPHPEEETKTEASITPLHGEL